jgi:hypothetical protein
METQMEWHETDGALDQFGDQYLTTGYCDQLIMGTQVHAKSLYEFSAAIEQVTHHTFPAQCKVHIHREPGKA